MVSLLDFTRALLAAAGTGSYRLVPFPEEAKRIDIGDYFGSFEKIRGELGWAPRVSLDEGLARTVEYYREHLHAYLD